MHAAFGVLSVGCLWGGGALYICECVSVSTYFDGPRLSHAVVWTVVSFHTVLSVVLVCPVSLASHLALSVRLASVERLPGGGFSSMPQ